MLIYFSQKQTEDALSYYRVCGLYFLAVVFMRSIVIPCHIVLTSVQYVTKIYFSQKQTEDALKV